MLRMAALIALSASISGCAGSTASSWKKPGASQAQIEQDLLQCKNEADRYTPTSYGDPIASGISDGTRTVRLRNDCMRIRGYQL